MGSKCPYCGVTVLTPQDQPCLKCLLTAETRGSGPTQPGGLGDTIAGFVLLGRVGEGGMAEVYFAEQTAPIRREVAIKIVKPGMDSRGILARFEFERQVMAMMNHPGIAKIHAAGLTRLGRPYFAMEYIDGKPITDWCAAEKPSIEERLRLAVQICQAIQHAHQKGVVHRDLKPSNILVTSRDNKATPVIIDFGISKAIEGEGPASHPETVHGQLFGTPAYMSPEQASGSEDIDTRSDIYSLAVVLYEILAGRPPVIADRSIPTSELLREIALGDAPLPSATAAHIHQEPHTANRLKGDLDAILMKALHRTPDQRYQTAKELADDILLHLDHRPIHARPPTAAYQLRRFVRRNLLPLSAAAAVLFALVAGLAASVYQATIARRETEIARTEQKRSKQILDIFVASMRSADPDSGGKDIPLRDVLLGAEAQAKRGLTNDLQALNQIRQALARTYNSLSDYTNALRLYKTIIQTEIEAGRGHTTETAETYSNLGDVQITLDELEDGLKNLNEGVELLRDISPPDWNRKINALALLGSGYVHCDQYDKAEAAWREGDDLNRTYFGGQHTNASQISAGLAGIAGRRGELTKRVQILEDLVQRVEMGQGTKSKLRVLYCDIALAYRAVNELPKALEFSQKAVALAMELYGPTNQLTAMSYIALSASQFAMRNFPAAEQCSRKAVVILDSTKNFGEILALDALSMLGTSLVKLDRAKEAEPYLVRRLQITERQYGTNFYGYPKAVGELGMSYLGQGRLEEARPMLEKWYAHIRRLPTIRSNVNILSAEQLRLLYQKIGQTEKVKALQSWPLPTLEQLSSLETGVR